MKKMIKVAELFSGSGGLSEGFSTKNYQLVSSIEIDKDSCETHRNRLIQHKYKLNDINQIIQNSDVRKKETLNTFKNNYACGIADVLLAGIPCQSFSSAGKAKDTHAMKNDPRNWLYVNFLKFLKAVKPKVFVIENVKGITSSVRKGINILDDILESAKKLGYLISENKKEMLLNSYYFSVPQNRDRIFIIGIKANINKSPSLIYQVLNKLKSINKNLFNVEDAIKDLPFLQQGQGEEEVDFCPSISNKYLKIIRKKNFKKLYNHVCRTHNKLDTERFKYLSKNLWELKDLARVRPDLIHHNPFHFKNRYTVQQWKKPGRTVIAHIHKDGNLFIHPDHNQKRTFTVREAARIQSFPDDFKFYGSRTSQFKQVGNAVPPMMAKKISEVIYDVVFK